MALISLFCGIYHSLLVLELLTKKKSKRIFHCAITLFYGTFLCVFVLSQLEDSDKLLVFVQIGFVAMAILSSVVFVLVFASLKDLEDSMQDLTR